MANNEYIMNYSNNECKEALIKYIKGEYTDNDIKEYLNVVQTDPNINTNIKEAYDNVFNKSTSTNINNKKVINKLNTNENIENTPNPLLECERENDTLITPNILAYNKANNNNNVSKSFKPTNIRIIQNLLKDALRCYKCDNGYYYLVSAHDELIPVKYENQHNIIEKLHSQLQEVTQKIAPINLLLPLEALRGQIWSNDNIIKFLDGIYDITKVTDKKNKKLTKITKETIPVCEIQVNYNYEPSENDKKFTKKILQYKFKKPKEFIKHLSDIMFNDTNKKLKQFTIVYGISNSGKSALLNIELTKLFGAIEVDINNFTAEKERTALTGNCKVIGCDEIQSEVLSSKFLNKYTGARFTPVQEKYNKAGKIDIKTKHIFFFGENTPKLYNQSLGTYNRVFLIETQNDLRKMDKKYLDYMNSQEYVDTLFYFMKQKYIKNSEILEQNITPKEYANTDNSLTSVLRKLIKEEPTYEHIILTDKKNVDYAKYIDESGEYPYYHRGYGAYFVALDYQALKKLLKLAQNKELLDKSINVDKISLKTLKDVLSGFVYEFNPTLVFDKKYLGKTKYLRTQIQPTQEGWDLLSETKETRKVLDYCTLYNPKTND